MLLLGLFRARLMLGKAPCADVGLMVRRPPTVGRQQRSILNHPWQEGVQLYSTRLNEQNHTAGYEDRRLENA